MKYNFEEITSYEFEELAVDIEEQLQKTFISLSTGYRDGGIDGYLFKNKGIIVIQAKKYTNKTDLFFQMKTEYAKIKKINPKRYILYTSCGLNHADKNKIIDIMKGYIKTLNDIKSLQDITRILKSNDNLESKYFKLYISTTSGFAELIRRIVYGKIYNYSRNQIEEIKLKSRYFVNNAFYKICLEHLKNKNVLIISGPPGVGKTINAEIIAYSYFLKKKYEFYAVNDIDEAFSIINEKKKQVFIYDDFFGDISLSNLNQIERLIKFINQVSKTKNVILIITTREYIYKEALVRSEKLNREKESFELDKYLLNQDSYDKKTKMRIIFNHIVQNNINKDDALTLLENNQLKKTIEHKNYKARIVEQICLKYKKMDTKISFGQFLYTAIQNSLYIWEMIFDSGAITPEMEKILILLKFQSRWGISTKEFKKICEYYDMSTQSYKQSLDRLEGEGSFIKMSKHYSANIITFFDPSVNDFLDEHLLRYDDKLDFLASKPLKDQSMISELSKWRSKIKNHKVFDVLTNMIYDETQKYLLLAISNPNTIKYKTWIRESLYYFRDSMQFEDLYRLVNQYNIKSIFDIFSLKIMHELFIMGYLSKDYCINVLIDIVDDISTPYYYWFKEYAEIFKEFNLTNRLYQKIIQKDDVDNVEPDKLEESICDLEEISDAYGFDLSEIIENRKDRLDSVGTTSDMDLDRIDDNLEISNNQEDDFENEFKSLLNHL